MAKIVDVTYGTHGGDKTYSYVVNDNVRTGDYINPSVQHWRSGEIFATTAIVQSTMKADGESATALKNKLANTNRKYYNKKGELIREVDGIEVARALTGKEAGAKKVFGEKGFKKAVKDEEDGMWKAPIEDDEHMPINTYAQQIRGANIDLRQKETMEDIKQTPQTEKAISAFEKYSRPFMQ